MRRVNGILRRVQLGTWIFFAIITIAYLAVVFGGSLHGKGVGPVSRAAILITWPVGIAVGLGTMLWGERRRDS
jgi:hypothetical protein